METVLSFWFTTARSSAPSPLKSLALNAPAKTNAVPRVIPCLLIPCFFGFMIPPSKGLWSRRRQDLAASGRLDLATQKELRAQRDPCRPGRDNSKHRSAGQRVERPKNTLLFIRRNSRPERATAHQPASDAKPRKWRRRSAPPPKEASSDNDPLLRIAASLRGAAQESKLRQLRRGPTQKCC